MLRLHLRKVPVKHEIGFLKKKLGSTQEQLLFQKAPLNSHRAICSSCSQP